MSIKQGTPPGVQSMMDSLMVPNPPRPINSRVVRLTEQEYSKVEQAALVAASQYRGTDAGALGVQVGVQLVLKALRQGVITSA